MEEHIPSEIVWQFCLFSELKDLENIFLVSKEWSSFIKNDVFWKEYHRNLIHIPKPKFDSGSLELKVKEFIDSDNLNGIKKIGISRLKGLKSFDYEGDWSGGKVTLDFLRYAVILGRESIVEYFIKNEIFILQVFEDETKRIRSWAMFKQSETNTFDENTCCLMFLAILFRQKELIPMLFNLGVPLYTNISRGIGTKLYEYLRGDNIEIQLPHAKENSLANIVYTAHKERCKKIPYLSIPLLLRDFDFFKFLVDFFPKEYFMRISALPNSFSLSVFETALALLPQNPHVEKYIDYLIQKGGFYRQIDKVNKLSVGEDIVKKIEKANERLDKDFKGTGYPVFALMLTGRMLRIDGCDRGETIHDLKAKIRISEGISEDRQRMIFWGKSLANGRTLKDYGILHYGTIFLVLRGY